LTYFVIEMNKSTGSGVRKLCLLGSTGSIGEQTLEVVRAMPDRFQVVGLSAQRNVARLAEQALEFRPQRVVLTDEAGYGELRDRLTDTGIEVASGADALADLAALPEADLVLTAVVGFAGLKPTLAAIDAGKDIAIANKETLVVAGEYVMEAVRRRGIHLLPVDSEHSALFQCLAGEPADRVTRMVLTASGGPFRGWDREQLAAVSPAQALKHPRWNMGAKISIDSATLMNKGLEVIEAGRLFGLPPERIEVVVHPESIIHSFVEFADGSIKAQLGLPDMRLPIQYALCWPDRSPNPFPRYDFTRPITFHFEPPDRQVFQSLDLAYAALSSGGDRPCVLNAANEIAVEAFLSNRIRFLHIYDCIEFALNTLATQSAIDPDSLCARDAETRRWVSQYIDQLN
jgi:1-deoxy-D-xylulose-5-phosphate reductoisomerase